MVDHKSPRPNLQNYDLSNGFFFIYAYQNVSSELQQIQRAPGRNSFRFMANQTEHFLSALKIFLHNYSLQKCNLHIYAIFSGQ